MKTANEEDACRAFMEILKRVKGVEYRKEDSPDEQSSSSDVDYILISIYNLHHGVESKLQILPCSCSIVDCQLSIASLDGLIGGSKRGLIQDPTFEIQDC
jgi:hypothetical protein